MMLKSEIQKSGWSFFFDVFNKQHEKWLVSIEISENENTSSIVKKLPLKRISSYGKENEITLILGNEDKKIFEYFIYQVNKVSIGKNTESYKELIINSLNGCITILSFSKP